MNDSNTFRLDEETTAILEQLATEEGMTKDEFLRKLLLDRASALLKKQEEKGSLFLSQMVERHQSV